MILLEKWKILTPLQNLPKNVGDLGKLIVAKVQKIAKSGHTASEFESCWTHQQRLIEKTKNLTGHT